MSSGAEWNSPQAGNRVGRKRCTAVLTAVDSGSGYALLAALSSKAATETTRVLIRLLELVKGRVRTITADCGKQVAG